MKYKPVFLLLLSGLLLSNIFAGCSSPAAVSETSDTTQHSSTYSPPTAASPTAVVTLPVATGSLTSSETIQETSSIIAASPDSINRPKILVGVDGIFYPETLTVPSGSTIDFDNEDCCYAHKLISDLPFTLNMEPGALIGVTFDKPGTYNFWLEGTRWVFGTIAVI